ncbi:heme-binding protein [Naasia sp. SYSU D00948]|uniref:heme-binding protein n=1 Tax=Naasia sp. SYSU D00948 TaxID=2817379 RepID=UPI001B30E091|nr:heme-binding protein [Naasia sp. SYSU D00948]
MARPDPTYTIDQLENEPPVDLPQFTRDDSVRLGEIAIAVIREWELDLAVDIHIGDELAFRAQFGSTGQGNADTMAGKRLTALHFGHSSMLAGLEKEADPSVADGLDDRYKFWGGCIPIFVRGELAATISTSGEPNDRLDHAAAEEALRRFVAERSS